MVHKLFLTLFTVFSATLLVPSLTGAPVISAGSADIVIGQSFTIPVTISNASGVFAFQFDVAFDPAILQLSSISEGDFLLSSGSTIFFPGVIDNSAGTATAIADTQTGNEPGASGNGVLVHLLFQATNSGTSPLTLSNGTLLDSNLSDIPLTMANGSVTVSVPQGSNVPEPALLSWTGLAVLAGVRLSGSFRKR